MHPLRLYIVKIEPNFDIIPYLGYFDAATQQKITAYYKDIDKIVAFTSALLKQYFLAALLNVNHNTLKFSSNEYKKPLIIEPSDIATKLQFNIAHTREYVALAVYFGNSYQIGVDIECIERKLSDVANLSSAVFSLSEQQLVNNNTTNFFKLWTKKEALLKAHGSGFITDFYRATNLHLTDTEITDDYLMHTTTIANHFISVCLLKPN